MLKSLPYSVQGVRDYFSGSSHYASIYVMLVVIVAMVFVFALCWFWYKNASSKKEQFCNNPMELFAGLLRELELTEQEKELLRQAAKGARLRHPAVCLLSPDLLSWTGRLWQKEKGMEVVDDSRLVALDNIAVKLYG